MGTDQASTGTVKVTVKDKLDKLQGGPRPRFKYEMAEAGADGSWERDSLDKIIRRVLRDARWHAFLFHGSYYWVNIVTQYFLPPGQSKDDLPADDAEVLRIKAKILGTVNNLKSDTLKRFDSHVKQVLKDYPELLTMPLREPDIARGFFINNIWSNRTFDYIWFWLRDYLDIRKSSELGRYFSQRKSPLSQLPPSQAYRYTEIYGTLCFATLLIERARIDEPKTVPFHTERRHAVYFECVIEPNFDDVSKSEFHEVLHKTRNSNMPTVGSLASIMMGTMPPPPPPGPPRS